MADLTRARGRGTRLARLSRAVAGAALGLLAASCGEGTEVREIAHFTTKACTNIGNALEAPKEGDWGYRIEEAHFDVIREAGFDTVRLPIRWSAHAQSDAPYTIDPAFFARVDEVIGWAFERDLSVIINIHHYNELIAEPVVHWERFLALWAQIAGHYKDHPLSLHFELLNEPNRDFKGRPLFALLREGLEVIRQTNETRVVIIGGAEWNSLDGLEMLPRFDDPYVVGTFHYYKPHEFTHQGAPFLDNPPPKGRPWGSSEDRAYLQRAAQRAVRQRQRLRRPLFLGEFGVFVGVPHEERVSWYKAVRETFEGEDIAWCSWNFAANFRTWDVDAQAWLPGMADALALRTGGTQTARVARTDGPGGDPGASQ